MQHLEGAPSPFLNLALNAGANLLNVVDAAVTGNLGAGYPARSRRQSADTGTAKGRHSLIGFNTGLNLLGSSASIGLNLGSDLYSRSRSIDGTDMRTATKRRQAKGHARSRNVVEDYDEDDEEDEEEEEEEEDDLPPPPPRRRRQVARATPTPTPRGKSKIRVDGPSIQPIEDDDDVDEEETAVVPARRATNLSAKRPVKAIAAPPGKPKNVKLVPVSRRLTAR